MRLLMRRSRLAITLAVFVGALPPIAGAQPPVRPLGRIVAVTAESLENVTSIRVLSDGRVLVNDAIKRRVLLFDSTLSRPLSIIDTTSVTARAYGSALSTLIAFAGDSSLFLDQASSAILVIDQAGKIVRIVAMPTLPRPQANALMGPNGGLAFDQAGRLVFHAPSPPVLASVHLPQGWTGDTLVAGPDSTAIVRVDLMSRRLDTIAMLQAPRTRQLVIRQSGVSRAQAAINPIPSGDDWTVLNDGTVAVVRDHDYHIDWIRPDGGVTSGPKVAHEWVRLTDSAKAAIMDSVRGADSATTASRDAALSPAERDSAARLRSSVAAFIPAVGRRVYVEPSDLPDYVPPFAMNGARADAEGDVWVRVDHAGPAGGLVYDVIDRRGALIDRVQIPGGTTLVGFAPGFAYLTSRVGTIVQLAKARIR